MIWIILFYILPGILNTILFRDMYDSLREMVSESDAYYSYAILCFLPVVNLLVCIYLIICYVREILRKD